MGGITNKSLKNILLQNWEIINSIKKNGLNLSFLSFFINKIISRTRQYLKINKHE